MRTEGRHRLYGADNVRRLVFVRRCRELGFSLEEVRGLLGLAERGRSCGEVRQMTLAHAARVRSSIRDLRRMERLLCETAVQCEGGQAPTCPILDVLQH